MASAHHSPNAWDAARLARLIAAVGSVAEALAGVYLGTVPGRAY